MVMLLVKKLKAMLGLRYVMVRSGDLIWRRGCLIKVIKSMTKFCFVTAKRSHRTHRSVWHIRGRQHDSQGGFARSAVQ